MIRAQKKAMLIIKSIGEGDDQDQEHKEGGCTYEKTMNMIKRTLKKGDDHDQ